MTIDEFIKSDFLEFADLSLFIKNEYDTLYLSDNGFLLQDIYGVLIMYAKNNAEFVKIIPLIPKNSFLISIHGYVDMELLQKYYPFTSKKTCFQYVYTPLELLSAENDAPTRTLNLDDLSFLEKNYSLAINGEYLKRLIQKKLIIGAEINGELVGFIGAHESGAMGLLFVKPTCRGRQIGYNLEKALINLLLSKNSTPLCHVESDNIPSIRLQEKLGLVKCENLVYWFSK